MQDFSHQLQMHLDCYPPVACVKIVWLHDHPPEATAGYSVALTEPQQKQRLQLTPFTRKGT